MSLILSYTPLGLSVTLRSPELNDTYDNDTGMIARHVRGGEPKVYLDPGWLTLESYRYTFTTITEINKDDFLDFVEQTTGLEVTLTDYDGSTRTGYILNGSIEIVTMKDTCSYDFGFDFMSQPSQSFDILTQAGDNLVTQAGDQVVRQEAI